MSRMQKFNMAAAITAVMVSIITIVLTVGAIPFKAGGLVERVEVCESKLDKVDQVAEDVSYIRGWIDSRKEHE